MPGCAPPSIAKGADFQPLPADPTEFASAQFERIRNADGKENAFDIATR